jgi:hypothetical protein
MWNTNGDTVEQKAKNLTGMRQSSKKFVIYLEGYYRLIDEVESSRLRRKATVLLTHRMRTQNWPRLKLHECQRLGMKIGGKYRPATPVPEEELLEVGEKLLSKDFVEWRYEGAMEKDITFVCEKEAIWQESIPI